MSGSPMRRQDRKDFWLFISPWVIGFVLFTAGPIIASLYLSFTDYSLFTAPRWVGAENFREIFAGDQLIYKAFWNTLFYTFFAVPLGIAAALGAAMLLNQQIRGRAVWRTLFYLPCVVSGVAMAVLWRWIFNPQIGLINTIIRPVLHLFHIADPAWLIDPHLAKPAYVLMSLWGIGGGMVIFLAGLQGIPAHLYEAAAIDGAGRWQRFRHVTLPMLTPIIFFAITMGVIGSFQIFAQAYVMTGHGVDDSTLFYVLYLFEQAFRYFRMGFASAMAWVLFVIILIVTVIQFRLARRWVFYAGDDA